MNNFEFLVLNYELYKVKTLGSGFRVQGSGFRVQGSGFRVQGSGFRVQKSEAWKLGGLNVKDERRTSNVEHRMLNGKR